jgi:hypothetical protein
VDVPEWDEETCLPRAAMGHCGERLACWGLLHDHTTDPRVRALPRRAATSLIGVAGGRQRARARAYDRARLRRLVEESARVTALAQQACRCPRGVGVLPLPALAERQLVLAREEDRR